LESERVPVAVSGQSLTAQFAEGAADGAITLTSGEGLTDDINASWNSYCYETPPKGAKGSVAELVTIFRELPFCLW
jgi:hypothetical protein